VSSPAAWHPDPSGAHDHRYWDGERWTEHVADAGVASIDPLPDGPARPDDDTAERRTEVIEPDGDTEVIEPDGDTEVIEPDGDTEVIEPRDPGAVGGSVGADGQPAPPTGAPIGDPAAAGSGWGGASAAAPPGGGGTPPAWAGQASSGPGWGTAPAAASTGLATTALVLGIVSLPLLVFFGLGALLGIAAIVVGIVALRRANRGEAGGRGLAIGGIATGAVSVLLGVLIVIALFAFGFGFADELDRCIEETGSRAECQERLERELTERFLGE
jgi:hypothetical protein